MAKKMTDIKVHDLEMTPAERKAKEHDMASRSEEWKEPEGIEIHVGHDHLKKMGYDNPPEMGAEVEMHGRGHVIDSGSHEGHDGKPVHHVRIRMEGMGLHDHTDAKDGGGSVGDLKEELFKNMQNSDEKQAKKDEAKASARGEMAKTGKKVKEDTDDKTVY